MARAALIVALVAVVIAGASAYYTWRQASATERITAIEEQRRHDERAPLFQLHAGKAHPSDWYRLSLRSRDHTGRLDSVRVTIDPSVDGRPGPFLGFTPDQDGMAVPAGSAVTDAAEYGPIEASDPPTARRIALNEKPHETVLYLTIVARAGDEEWTSHYEVDVPRTRFGPEGSFP